MTTSNPGENVRPRLRLLGPEALREIHRRSLDVLEETGVRVESERAVEIFRRSDAAKIERNVVRIGRELVEHAIHAVPSSVEVFSRSGEPAFHLGERQGGETHFGIGVTNMCFENVDSGRIEAFTRHHTRVAARLGELLRNFDMVSTPGVPGDAPSDKLDLYSTLDMTANTSKPLVLLIQESGNLRRVFNLLAHLHGEIGERPSFILYLNPVTPLVLNASTTDKMITAIDAGLPVIYSNYGMYGATSPATASGTLTLLNAELLAGLALGQLVKEGAPMILGSLPAAFDMQTSGSRYTTTSYLLNLACAEMMSHYSIPHCGTSGCGNGWGADVSACGDLWLNHLTSCVGKVGCAPFVGGNFDSLVFSPRTVVLSDQIIGEARKLARGFALDDRAVDAAAIAEAGPGGDYLTSEATLASLADLRSANPLWPPLSLDGWKARGAPTAETFLIGKTRKLYARAVEELAEGADVIERGERYIAAGG